ncbi:MAG TPA: hypothetical protein VKW76_11145 [Candidatus Binatia bacterium]|nr:hypothetical protein [Candidatus Binatia bacterium]
MARTSRPGLALALTLVSALAVVPSPAQGGGGPCTGGRFLADPSGTSLIAAIRTGTRDAIVLDAGEITVESSAGDCGPARAKLRRVKGGALVQARWESCPGVTGVVKLQAHISSHCTLLKGTLRIGHGRRRKIRATLSSCGDRFVDTAAGEQCEPPSTAICDASCHFIGSSDLRQCPSGRVSCNGICVDPRSDPNNCGACATVCPGAPGASPRCIAGACSVACRPGFGDCDGNPANGCETNLNQDVAHCGTCDSACPAFANATPACSGGRCTSTCVPGFGDCDGNPLDGCETDLTTDPAHCGKCTVACVGNATTTASCQGGSCQYSCTDPGPGEVICGKSCVDVNTDARNCGGCRDVCPPGEVCTNGTCACGGNLSLCGSRCTDLATDPANCSQCGHACPPGDSCDNGHCSCDAPKKVCSGVCSDLTRDVNNCGQCGHVCPLGDSCVLGKCVCPQPKVVCSGRCVDLNTNNQNCGKCGIVCTPDFVCTSGECICPDGFDICSKRCTNLETDRNNCGRCGFVCPGPPPPLLGGEICVAGGCVCPTGYKVCSGLCIDPQSDSKNCGTCGHACPQGKSCIKGNCITP